MPQTPAFSLDAPSNNDDSTKKSGSTTSRSPLTEKEQQRGSLASISPTNEKDGPSTSSLSQSPPNGVTNDLDLVNTEVGRASETPADAAPDGGINAWLQVFGAFFLNMNSWCVGYPLRTIRVLTIRIGALSTRSGCIKHTT